MKVEILNTIKQKTESAAISLVANKKVPLKKNGWQFNWKELSKVEGATLFKLSLSGSNEKIEGILMLTMFNEEMLLMNNLEVAPHNIGKNKIYDNVAGCLLAFACKKSFEIGKGHYKGFLSFESKTELIELYQDKYGAQWAMGHKMFIDPIASRKLMKKYLGIKYK